MFATHPLRTIFGFISSTYSYLYEPYSDLYQVLILTFTNHIRIYILNLYEPYSDLYLILTFTNHIRTYLFLPLRTIFGFISSTYSYLYEPYSDLYQVLILTFTNHIRIYIKYLFLPLRTFTNHIRIYIKCLFLVCDFYAPYSDLY